MQDKENLFAILQNETNKGENWEEACQKFDQPYKFIDLTKADWLEQIRSHDFTYFLACPSGLYSYFKKQYDERIYIIEKVLKQKVYPAYHEIMLHENKKFLSYWLQAKKIPHPQTSVFYYEKEAVAFLQKAGFPLVGKINIGASGIGVNIFRNKEDAATYVKKAFSSGIKSSAGPNIKMGKYRERIWNILKNPGIILRKFRKYKKQSEDVQQHFVIFQEYIPHDFEWRMVKIADSYFGYKKRKKGEKASGGKGYIYDTPPEKLLDFVRKISMENNFRSMAFDIFEHQGNYLINELQTIFGHVADHICEKDGKPGRFLYNNGKWEFEEGMFNSNISYDLRMEDVIDQISNPKNQIPNKSQKTN